MSMGYRGTRVWGLWAVLSRSHAGIILVGLKEFEHSCDGIYFICDSIQVR